MLGRSLSDYVLDELKEVASVPTEEELRERLAKLSGVRTDLSHAQAVRAERDSR